MTPWETVRLVDAVRRGTAAIEKLAGGPVRIILSPEGVDRMKVADDLYDEFYAKPVNERLQMAGFAHFTSITPTEGDRQ